MSVIGVHRLQRQIAVSLQRLGGSLSINSACNGVLVRRRAGGAGFPTRRILMYGQDPRALGPFPKPL